MKYVSPAVVSVLALAVGAAYAQPRSHSDISKADTTFATKAAAAGLAEVAEAQTAISRSNRQDVKNFAQRMITDHSKANDQLKQIASADGVTLPTAPNNSDRAKVNALSSKSGAAFDQAYIKDQRAAHKDAVALFTSESKSGKNQALRDFATSTLPTLKEHEQMINALPIKESASQ
jgi:putative membrane protein